MPGTKQRVLKIPIDLVTEQSTHEAKALAVTVYRVASEGRLAKDFGLKDQMQRLGSLCRIKHRRGL